MFFLQGYSENGSPPRCTLPSEDERESPVDSLVSSISTVFSEVQQSYPRDGHDHTVSCLELSEHIDLATSEQWKAAAAQLASSDGSEYVFYSYDLDRPLRLVVVVRWKEATPVKIQVETTESALNTVPCLVSPVRCHQITLGQYLSDNGRSSQTEIYIVKGDETVVKPDLLGCVEDLERATVPDESDIVPEALNSVTYGVNPLLEGGNRTISFCLQYFTRTNTERQRFKDPKEDSCGADHYESLVAPALEQWRGQGATVDIYAVNLQCW